MAPSSSKKKAFEAYLKKLKDPDPETRKRAARDLAYLDDARAVPHLIDALSDKDKKVRWRAAYALGHFGETGSEEAFKALASQLEIEPDWNVRRIIVMTFRHWGKMPIEPLIRALEDKSPYVRRYAAMTLGYKKSKEGVEPLKKLLEKEESKEVKDYAGWAIEKIKKDL